MGDGQDSPVDAPEMSMMPDMDVEPDLGPVDMGPVIPPECDKDGDGSLAMECGGDDCDDNDPRRSPRFQEICDNIDNNCSGEINDGITCVLFAHTANDLYQVDPFKKTATRLGTLPGLLDIDTHPNGTLYGVTARDLFKREMFGDWERVGSGLGVNFSQAQVNGLAIDQTGIVYATGGTNLYRVGVATGRAELLGSLGAGNTSSGDCVVNKGNNLYVTVKAGGQHDRLIQAFYNQGGNPAVTVREVGSIGFANVYGLTAAWGQLYGLTSNGELITIDERTGAGSLVHRFNGIVWYGAASTPDR
jgi:hypothetical protein